MKQISQYLDKNSKAITKLYNDISREQQLPATKLHSFLKEIFKIEPIMLLKDGKNYYEDDQNQAETQSVIQQYYKSTADGKASKFYLYRISFPLQEIQEYLRYWFKSDSSIQVNYPSYVPQKNQQQPVVQTIKNSSLSQNQFLSQQHRAPIIQYEQNISQLEEQLLKVAPNSQQAKQIQNQIQQFQQKIQNLQTSGNKKSSKMQKQQSSSPSSPSNNKTPKRNKKSLTQSKNKKQINFKVLFEFYAKQNHFTHAKVSFQRIEHQSQTINYQKLVHFLKQYDLFPEKASAQRKLHNLYVRGCCSTRDLRFQDFMALLQKLPEIVIETQTEANTSKRQIMMNKILSKTQKNKLLLYPFHSLQKNNFRIDSHGIKYQFQLKPMQGKLAQDINNDLQLRRKQKQLAKEQHSKQKQQRLLKKVKRLMQTDPHHPLVVQNRALIEANTSHNVQPVVNLNNMQRFRDASFDFKAKFGINLDQDPLLSMHRYNKGSRMEEIERQQSSRMSALMSGIVQRSQAKIQRFSVSPKKRQGSPKLN